MRVNNDEMIDKIPKIARLIEKNYSEKQQKLELCKSNAI